MRILDEIRPSSVRLGLCVIVSSICLYLAVRGMGFEQVFQELKKTSFMPVIGAVSSLFLSFWIRAWRWSYLLSPVKEITPLPLFRCTLIGYMGNYLLPFRAGELMRAVSIGQSQRISKASAFGSIVLERVFDGVVLSLTPLLLLAVLDVPQWVMRVNLIFIGVYATALLIIVFSTQQEMTGFWLRRASSVLPALISERLGSIGGDFLQGMRAINRARALLPASYLSLLCWFCRGMYYFLLFEALNLDLSVWAALVLQVVIGLGVMLPAAPGYIGNFEYFTVVGLALFGITQEAAFAYALVAHIFQFVPVTIAGLFFAFKMGLRPVVEPGATDFSISTRNLRP